MIRNLIVDGTYQSPTHVCETHLSLTIHKPLYIDNKGHALVDMTDPNLDYTESQAREAFYRVASAHGWQA